MEFTSLSMAHDHLNHVQHSMDNWTQDTLEGDNDLCVAYKGLQVKCQLISDTLDELLSCNNNSGDSEPDGSDEVFCHFGMSCSVLHNEL
jgi:hypothetical protein